MKDSEAFDRYAKALFRVQASQDLDTLLTASIRLIQDTPLFPSFLEHPQISLDSKRRVLQTSIGNPLLVRFLTLLIERKRLKHLSAIALKYHQMWIEEMGLTEAHLVTAFPTDSDITNKLKLRLEQEYHKAFVIKTSVDPRLIGGAILFIGNTLLDYSFKGRLSALKNDLLRGLNA